MRRAGIRRLQRATRPSASLPFPGGPARHARRLPFLLLPLLLTACGGGDAPTTPQAPGIEGTYELTAGIDGRDDYHYAGELQIRDTDRQDETFAGTYTISLARPDGTAGAPSTGELTNTSIDRGGQIGFTLAESTWTMTGRVALGAISGRWDYKASTGDYAGAFTASVGESVPVAGAYPV